ncbi:MAG: ribonuclease R [Bacteroidales bacterium]|nr:ribonuclease R [Bacteroidales bacterium]
MSKEKKKNSKRLKKREIAKRIMDFFTSYPKEGFNYKQVSRAIGIENDVQKMLVLDLLLEMASDDFLKEIERGKFKLGICQTVCTGTFERKNNGKNLFIPEDGGIPALIYERNAGHAMNGDTVKVQLFAKRKKNQPEGEVIEIIKRAKSSYVGILQVVKDFAFLVTDSKILANDIYIPKSQLKGGKNGQKAIVEITEWPENAKNPIGRIIDILGDSGNNNTEMHAILAEYGLPYKYPDIVEKSGDSISDKIPKEEIKKREDFRNVTTFTIDPKDAKDFDDAISIRKLPNGLWEIGVHIADVTYYVKPNDIIDKEAESRATSVYLVDRTIPMLPERLCNQLCSLRPNEEKLCFSAIFEMDDQAVVKNSRVAKCIIKSNRRFTYEEAQSTIETGKGDFKEEVLALNSLAKILREKRFANGAIAFDREEVRFDIDENGKPLNVYFKESKESNHLVEEFMLLANKAVAELIGKVPRGKKPKTFVYRIHNSPDPEKLANFGEFIRKFGYKLRTEGSKTEMSKSINRLLDQVEGKREENLINTVAVRTMAKAIYSTENIGHYGLAFDYYTHFTSPIRRYPDMMVHRLLERYLTGGRSVSANKYEKICEHCSSMEQLAATAERASIKYKQVEFMQNRLGMVFDGLISGVTEWGIYVELNENKCEGMIPIRDLDDDYYEFDEKNYCLRGRRHKKQYRLGDAITIKVAAANLERKQLDFQLV